MHCHHVQRQWGMMVTPQKSAWWDWPAVLSLWPPRLMLLWLLLATTTMTLGSAPGLRGGGTLRRKVISTFSVGLRRYPSPAYRRLLLVVLPTFWS